MKSFTTQMAWRNVWRNPRRSLLTMAAVAFASLILIFMLSWQFGSYDTMINTAVAIHTGHLQVQAEGYQDSRSIGKVVERPKAVTHLVAGTEGVAAHTTRASAFSLASSEDRTYASMVVGIDPEREPAVSTLESLVRRGSFLAPDDRYRALIGRLLARNLQVDVGDEIVLLGQGRDGSIAASAVRVKGVFESGQDEFDRSTVQIPLAAFQEVFAMRGAVHEVVVLCNDLDRVPAVQKRLAAALGGMNEELVVLDWKELMPGLVQSIQMDLAVGFVFYVILILVVAFSILNTFLMAIFERKKEFGVLLALGSRPGRISRMILAECGLMTGLGIAAGILLGAAVTLYFESRGIAFSGAEEILRQFGLPERMYPELSLLSIAVGTGVVLLITSFAVIYPALRVLRLRPVEAVSTIQ
jgi:ABC-type lipoprotein release transport system permease subunit